MLNKLNKHIAFFENRCYSLIVFKKFNTREEVISCAQVRLRLIIAN
ncbi:hypothetical protein [Clostridium phage Maintenon]|nr:hypothetical protein [Clostridium phage Maintenon]